MKKIALMIAVTAALCALANAADVVFKPGQDNVSTYGKSFSNGDIKSSQNKETLKFELKADPMSPAHSRVIQIYSQSYKLKPGSYVLTLEMKTDGDAVVFPVELVGKKADESWFKMGQNYSSKVEGDWTTVSVPVSVEEKTPHSYVKLAVGQLPLGTKLELKRTFTFTQQ